MHPVSWSQGLLSSLSSLLRSLYSQSRGEPCWLRSSDFSTGLQYPPWGSSGVGTSRLPTPHHPSSSPSLPSHPLISSYPPVSHSSIDSAHNVACHHLSLRSWNAIHDLAPKQSGFSDNKTTTEVQLCNDEFSSLHPTDYNYLIEETGMSRSEINELFHQFYESNPDGDLSKRDFVKLYAALRQVDEHKMERIARYVFNVFDVDNNGSISFDEFLIAYALSSRGEPKKKLAYAFNVYDIDGDGSLDTEELTAVIKGMLMMMGDEKTAKSDNPKYMAMRFVEDSDKNGDGKISKDEFIEHLLSNDEMRALMSPF